MDGGSDNDWISRRWQGEGRVVRRASDAPAPAPSGPNRVSAPADGDMMNPDLGHHCSKCHRLDFLPSRCDCCHATFCSDCADYEAHDCPNKHTKSRTVPVCPLCQEAVPIKPGEDANAKMEQHIAGGCAKPVSAAVFTNRCNHRNCKKRELVQCICKGCGLNHCIKHRQPDSHRCGQAKPPPKAAAKAAAPAQHPLAASLAARRVGGSGGAGAGGRGGGPASAAAAAAERRAQAASAAAARQHQSAPVRAVAPAPAPAPPAKAAASTTAASQNEDEELQRALALSMEQDVPSPSPAAPPVAVARHEQAAAPAVLAAPTAAPGVAAALAPLLAMGYPADAAAEAMAATAGDVQRAALLLMENASALERESQRQRDAGGGGGGSGSGQGQHGLRAAA